tara:strand:- start:488 stop:1246 length:759 start_codon:yes stop_codon:yes gene_type:complete
VAEVPEIKIDQISIPEIIEWRSLPPQSIPNEPPITLQLGFPMADLPGCVETRSSAAGNEQVYTDDPRGNLVICGAEMPSYKPLNFTPGTLTYSRAKPPPIDPDTKKPAEKSNQPDRIPSSPSADLDIPSVAKELPCPPPDAIPLGAKNKSQTAVIVGYERIDGKCEAVYEQLDIPSIIGNYLPGAPVVATTATTVAVATTVAIFVKPLGDILLKAVKPIVKKTIKKIKEKLGKKAVVESVFQRRKFQRALRK